MLPLVMRAKPPIFQKETPSGTLVTVAFNAPHPGVAAVGDSKWLNVEIVRRGKPIFNTAFSATVAIALAETILEALDHEDAPF